MNRHAKVTIGKSEVNGFFTVNGGDIYRMKNGELAIVAGTGNGTWQLRHITDDGRPDFMKPPLDGWQDIDGQMAMVRKINQEFGEVSE